MNPALSVGLPAFLTKGAGMFSGMMLSQYTADSLIVEQRMLSAPASVASIPAAADQEDFVSMGMNTAIKNGQILDNANGVLGIEFMAAAQALDFLSLLLRESGAQETDIDKVDTQRVDRLGCYGSERGLTPNLDRLASRGVLFEEVVVSIPRTTQSPCVIGWLMPPWAGSTR